MNMQFMRDKSSSLLIVLLFGAIIVVFALQFGPGSKGCTSSRPIAGTVNGEAITTGEWSFYYDQLFSYYQRFDPRFNNDKADQYKLKEKALEQIVDSMLLAQTGEDMGLYPSQKEVAQSIFEDDSFKEGEEGYRKFSKELYRRMVNYYYKMSVKRYEKKRYSDMTGGRVRSILTDGPMVSENYARHEWELEKEQINLEFVRFKSARGEEGVIVTDDEAKKFVTEKKDEVEKYYTDHLFDYEKAEQVRVRHILVRLAGEDDADAAGKAEAKAKAIYEKVKAAPDSFAELAKENSEDLSNKEKGGDLGFFGRGSMVKEFEDSAFSLEVGQISEPVKTRFGYHVLKLEEKKLAFKKELEEVQDDIAHQLLREQKSGEKVRKEAEAFLAKAKEGKSFEEVLAAMFTVEPKAEEAKEVKPDLDVLKAEKTGPFARTANFYMPRIGADEDLFKAVWNLGDKALADKTFEINGDFFVIKQVERTKPKDDDFMGEKQNLMERLAREFGGQAYENWLKVQRDDANIQTNYKIALFSEGGENAAE